ncbi:Glycosyltransferase [Dissulfuribacter thermophilus]|uniref:Glycosyltransferase n=1 Tax=Dissulfuribacter thermophilus TaxID=1156395 RepID=A0A1B9F4I9_9BACT|nr:glycosyltransferase [Dissulfuribacter thermophilus]OCC14735.1 Glycosyltransferase [Dissulfuribacter thermophilus]
MYQDKNIAVVIPALNEAETIGQVVRSLPEFVDQVVVADNGSQDQTAQEARRAGAVVVFARQRGYGSACLAAIEYLSLRRPDIIVFMDGDGSDDPEQMEDLLRPIVESRCDLVLASRTLGKVESGAMTPVQKFGNQMASWLIDLIWARKFTDLGPYRAISWSALKSLQMSDPDYGWTVEMQIKSARLGLRVKEIPANYRQRQGGQSKVSGTIMGSCLAGWKIISWIVKEALRDRKYLSLGFISYLAIIGLILAYFYNKPLFNIRGQVVYLTDFLVFSYVFVFGLYRFFSKDHPYQKIRIHVIVWLYLIFWGIMPYFFGLKVPTLGGGMVLWPAIHVIGSVMFFIYGLLMIFFGRRLDCGWNCPCVATRETVGFAFRRMTARGKFWWRLRYLKYAFLALLLVYLGYLLFDPTNAYQKVGGFYYKMLTNTYYLSYLFLPLWGNRSYCRVMCPYAALWGIYSYLGFFRIEANSHKCTGCGLCETVCDMGIPIREYVSKGKIRTVECMGCGRCVNICPKGALEIKSAWAYLERPFGKFLTNLGLKGLSFPSKKVRLR